MRFFYIALVIGVTVLLSSLPLQAQSGSRSSGFSGRSGGSSSGRSSGSSGRYSGGSRLSRSERQRLAREQFEQQQIAAQQAAQRQSELNKQLFKESLIQLAQKQNNRANAKQNQAAFNQAKKDFKALRSRNIAPTNLGPLNVPFRLTNEEIDRAGRTVIWPESLKQQEFAPLVQSINSSIENNAVMTKDQAIQFLRELQDLNQSLNVAAAGGELEIADFANSRRFITGLANEVRASNLLM
jgi:hypothetical protein